MQILRNADLAPHTTFGVPAKAAALVTFQNAEELRACLQHPELKELPRLVIGGGSNLLFTRDWPGVVLLNAVPGIDVLEEDADSVLVRAGAGGAWETPQVLDGRRHGDEWAIPCGAPLALGGGRWMFPMERHAKAHVPEWLRGYHAFAALSEDDGRTWPELVPMLNDPERRVAHYDQRCTVLPSGRIVSLAWAHDVIADVTLPARVGFSDDGGRTWSAAADTGILAGPVNPVALPDGRIFASYARRTAPRGVRCCLSEDGGRTWRVDRELVIFDEATARIVGEPASVVDRIEPDPSLWGTMWGWTFGQPMPVALPDGQVGVVFFAQGPDRLPSIRFVRIDVADA